MALGIQEGVEHSKERLLFPDCCHASGLAAILEVAASG